MVVTIEPRLGVRVIQLKTDTDEALDQGTDDEMNKNYNSDIDSYDADYGDSRALPIQLSNQLEELSNNKDNDGNNNAEEFFVRYLSPIAVRTSLENIIGERLRRERVGESALERARRRERIGILFVIALLIMVQYWRAGVLACTHKHTTLAHTNK